MEAIYLIVSIVVIGGFITFQFYAFPHWPIESYIGLFLSFSGCIVALLRGIL